MISPSGVRQFAIIPTHNRPSQLHKLVISLHAQADVVIILDNASEPHVTQDDFSYASGLYVEVIRDEEQPPNLSRLWNVGLDVASTLAGMSGDTRWDVAVLNDDAVLPPNWFEAMSTALRGPGCTAAAVSGSLHHFVSTPILKTTPDNDLLTRMCPWAFVMRGELGLRVDENMRWWWSDTDLDWRLRQNGGVLILPDYIASNSLANSTTVGFLAEQAGRDRETFARKWGYNPW